MTKFAFIYRDANPPATPEEGKAHMEKWRAWAEGLGEAYIYPGMPFLAATIVSTSGVSEYGGGARLNGVSIIEADSPEAAQQMAQGCPHLNLGGDIVVAEGMDLEM